MRDYFDCGYVKANHAKNKKDATYVYVVRNRDDLIGKIIPFFEQNHLQTEKKNDFDRFAIIVRMMNDGMHRQKSGLRKILKLAYEMNQGGTYRKKFHSI